jgi:hypothetical protein
MTREVVVSALDGCQLLRFPLEHGIPVVVGRGQMRHGIDLTAGVDNIRRLGRISREHAVLKLDEHAILHATDLASANGSSLVTVGADGTETIVRLKPDQESRVSNGRLLELAGVVRLRLSGRKIVADTRLPEGRSAAPPATEIYVQ